MFVEKLSALSIVVEHVYCKKSVLLIIKQCMDIKNLFLIFLSAVVHWSSPSRRLIQSQLYFFITTLIKILRSFSFNIYRTSTQKNQLNKSLRLHALKIHFNNKQTAASTSHSLIQICVHLLILCLSKLHSCTE